MRCFIALCLPEGARLSLARAVAAYREALSTGVEAGATGLDARQRGRPRPRISWTRAEGYHLTLAFLGEIEGAAIDAAAAALDAAAGFGEIGFRFAGLGGFPRGGSSPKERWRLLFAKVEDGGRSAELHRRVDEAFAGAAGGGPFLPHVTLARAGTGPGMPAWPAARAGAALEGAWTIGRCALYKSELRSSGSVYTEIRAVGLSGT
jgi:RNA 2',3'-cyclic 3'-phosphodiesterase